MAKAPFQIAKILTANKKVFTDRFCAIGERKPAGKHLFDQVCAKKNIKHLQFSQFNFIKPQNPQTNGMVERFNQRVGKKFPSRISEILTTSHFDSSQNLKVLLERYLYIYNHPIPQISLGYRSPAKALQQWQQKKPDEVS